jgi:hypothetical protein
MVIDILRAYKTWFSKQYDGKKTLSEVSDVFGDVPADEEGEDQRTDTQRRDSLFASQVSKGGDGDGGDFSVDVDGTRVTPSTKLTLLGVMFDRTLDMSHHNEMVAAAVRQRASTIACLSHHLPRGAYLRQLATGLVNGKILHAPAAVTTPRLEGSKEGANAHNYTAEQKLLHKPRAGNSYIPDRTCSKSTS